MKIKDLLKSEAQWTKGSFARDKDGKEVPYGSPDAVCYCLLGATHLCYSVPHEVDKGDRKYYEIRNILFDYIIKKHNIVGVMGFNDGVAKFEDVKQLVEDLDI